MSDYRRLIAYIYEYDGRMRLGNKGFARIDVRNGCGRLFVSIKDIKKETKPMGVYFYRWSDGIMRSVKVNELTADNGSGELRVSFKIEDILDGIDFEDISGIIVGNSGDSGNRMYAAEWDERDINMALLDINGAVANDVQLITAAECVDDDNADNDADNNSYNDADNNSYNLRDNNSKRRLDESDWRSIFNGSNVLQPFDDDMMYDCVEVTPDLMEKVPFCAKNLRNNSFLLHGYFNYGHIMVGKLARPGDGERYFVGIPGVYSNRERVIASMFGFENFRRSVRREYKHPHFGYWYSFVDE